MYTTKNNLTKLKIICNENKNINKSLGHYRNVRPLKY